MRAGTTRHCGPARLVTTTAQTWVQPGSAISQTLYDDIQGPLCGVSESDHVIWGCVDLVSLKGVRAQVTLGWRWIEKNGAKIPEETRSSGVLESLSIRVPLSLLRQE